MTTRRKAAAAAAMPEAAADEVYVIEYILDVRKSRDGTREFLVKWWNYGPEWNTWEPGPTIVGVKRLDLFSPDVLFCAYVHNH
jgi:hypothetical protein